MCRLFAFYTNHLCSLPCPAVRYTGVRSRMTAVRPLRVRGPRLPVWRSLAILLSEVLNHLHKKLRNMSKKSEASKKKTAQTVLVVVVVFCLSWLPHHVVHLWVEFGNFPLTQWSFLFRVAAHCLAYSNSSVNPVIYAFLSENFRKAYKQVFRCQITNSPLNELKEFRSKVDNTPPSTNCTNV